MRKIFLFIFPPIILILQTTGINFVLSFCLALVILKSFNKSWREILLLGVLVDMFSALPFGLITISLISAGYLIDVLRRYVFSNSNFWTKVILLLSGVLVYRFVLTILAGIFLFNLGCGWKCWIIEIGYSLVISGVFIYELQKIFYKKSKTGKY